MRTNRVRQLVARGGTAAGSFAAPLLPGARGEPDHLIDGSSGGSAGNGVVGAGIVQLIVAGAQGGLYPTVGASGGVFGILLAYGLTFPNRTVMLIFPPIPMKAKYFVLFYGLLELYLGVSGNAPGIAHFAHLGGMLFGFLLLRYWAKPRRRG